ncbi:frataxin family protein [Aspergillus ruber CBS 135680]|uniref:ferroxidase n=1 Tax=Aspergillus ruber (strain CBS 135680) TaxID=1388766 RepID=A0A017SS77_ASPRC|nr:Frataxin [Aspergillus ruber CBS 135680]EYE99847.1 Frataxin [Aspergillus ruber CBS 135680]
MLPRAPRALLSALRPSLRISRILAPAAIHPQVPQQSQLILRQSFHSSPITRKGIHPESSEPPAPKPQSHNVAGAAVHITEPTPLTDAQYYEYSEHYLESLLNEVERTAQEDASDLEGEYNAGVLNIIAPGIGTFVLNKQPPNKQIWLSSPISGPKRYDWIVESEGQNEKQGTRTTVTGQWVYLRDGSNLTDLLNSELGLNLSKDIYSEELY